MKKNEIITREEHIEEVLVELEKVLSNFQLTISQKSKTIQGYIKLLKLAKIEQQKIFSKYKSLKQEIELIKKQNQIEKKKKTEKKAKQREYKEITDTESESEEIEAGEKEEEPEPTIYKRI